ncbi:relaxase/mobilization nuclease domain-containing protein [Mucilaginibacter sp. BJC16-A38]|uniref:relaxase/mobilization nuclease domain-containing protein n=1 Tax=Mucilaginibacter phenanthrenivorans TaxID=1234842 RepID=UPI0021585C49|nr:relaxase/mobilization nuclease domain-containing protein [Mucilaginibacter phenanthrenivorans]MCR8559042.1 relaxase/mobilization nuclease domain-containing protein [Mucilaginibacter phenanthrenivorans]
MVAKIKSGKSLIGALNYNENKVKAGKAKLIATSGYMKSHETLSFYDKLFRLTDLAERNHRTKTNTVHLSLNFDVTENLKDELLVNIGDEYMKKIGFANQPYLIYKHFDAGHPHIHIVTTNIEADGKRISLHNIGELVSEPARKAIEIDFGLVQASNKEIKQDLDKNINIQPIQYGQIDTKRGITNIVNVVTKTYKFTSLPELNAILGQFNVMADKGTKESVMFKNGGLHYWVIDKNGKKTGVPIKASSIYNKPTLKLLDERFRLNEYLRKPFKEKLKAKIDKVTSQAISLEQFKSELKKFEVTVIIRENAEGRIFGMSYIDNANKAIFNGSDLGKSYSAASIIEGLQYRPTGNVPASVDKESIQIYLPGSNNNQISPAPTPRLLEELLNPLDPNSALPTQFGQKKKKKKRRKLNL